MKNDNSNGPDPKDAWKQYIPSEVNESWKENQEMWKQEGESWQTMFGEAKKLHEKAVNGDEKAVKKVFKLLKEVKKKVPSNNLVEAYYGSVIALLGRDASDTMDRFRLVRKGMKILDEIVEKEPENIEIRMLRGYVSYNIPEMYFQRTSTAAEDFNYLIEQRENDSSIFSEKMYWQILYDLGVSYKRLDNHQEASKIFGKLLRLDPDDEFKALIENEEKSDDAVAPQQDSKDQSLIDTKPKTKPQQEMVEEEEFFNFKRDRKPGRRSKARRS
ncbi:hypothetical protein E3U55_08585 [Filobacillus milosensis]|uniref:Uncharacterized protein n=1 Tax=Filobacillus milosensis TaxID=94137 RepID=A0A4Y8IK32_9BACI|nr:tetratricopeptide repeat protein [Filobacillus milosensis]TFB21362.1 hypothetical protein E3U55_08585 [Filobacillus milosensis]